MPNATEVRVVSSIDSTTDWTGLLEDIDVVVHLAARVHVMRETEDAPLEAFREINTRGTQRLAEACVAQGVKRLVYMSSIKVNGEETNGRPFSAEDAANPLDPYGVSKWEAEEALRAIAGTSSLEVVVLRPTVIYGSGVGGNIERILRLVRTRVPLPFGSVENQRTILSVHNLGLWVLRAISDDVQADAPVLVGDPRPVSTKSLVAGISQGLKVRPIMLPIPVAVMQFFLRVLGQQALAQRLLGDLECRPSFGAFPGIEGELQESEPALRQLGESMAKRQSPSAARRPSADALSGEH